jgi:phosphohistidine phosphatase
MKIHLIRHAKTDPTSLSGKDFDRKLLPKGIVQANVLAYYLLDHGVQPEITWCSDAVRTRETLSIIQRKIDPGKIVYSKDLYLADREVLLKKTWELKHGKELMIIGHNDGISSFASYLTDEQLIMKTGEYLCIEFTADLWQETSRGTGKIIANFRPSVFLPG